MVVCPLIVGGDIIGTLNVGRMGGPEAHFSRDEFELVRLFAAQASIALGNAETHGAVVTQADHDALTGLRNHGAFQRDLGDALAIAARDGRPFAAADARPRQLQGLQRPRTATPRATRCCAGSPTRCAARSARRTGCTATAATSSRSSCPAPARPARATSRERIRHAVGHAHRARRHAGDA